VGTGGFFKKHAGGFATGSPISSCTFVFIIIGFKN